MFSFLKSKLFIFCIFTFLFFSYVFYSSNHNRHNIPVPLSSLEISFEQYKLLNLYHSLLLDYFSGQRTHSFNLSSQSLSSVFLIPSTGSYYINLKIVIFEIYKDNFISIEEYNSLSSLSKYYFLQDFPLQ